MRARPLPEITSQGRAGPRARDWATLGALAALGPLLAWLVAAANGGPAFNDFNIYWLAGQLVDRGLSPHDGAALAELGARQGREFVLGGGYSYPLPFAVAMVPLSRLPFESALGVFLGVSIAVYSATVVGWLRWLGGWAPDGGIPLPRMRWAALLAGCFPPVLGTVTNGQANLLVLGVMAPGVALALSGRPGRWAGGGALVGLAAVVKLVPAVAAVPLLLARRGWAAAALLVAITATLAGAALLAPGATHGSESLVALLDPDPYFTNVSINGFVSRLLVSTDRTLAPAPGLVDPRVAMALATAAFALATGWWLWRARAGLAERRTLALAVALAIVAGVAGAPKDSFWNATLALVPVALLLAAAAPDLDPARLRAAASAERRLVAAFVAGVALQPVAWLAPAPLAPAPLAWLQTLAGSLALGGLVGLWWLVARRLRATVAGSHQPSAAVS